jgi:two-component system sensor histidine kinase KdpD
MNQGVLRGYAAAIGAVALATAAGFAMTPRFELVNVAMVYLLAIVCVALRCSRGAAIASAILCIASFDFLFVPPRFTLQVDDAQYMVSFAIMIAVALVISHLVEAGNTRARREAALELEAESERIRGTLLASISHDLRTPLAVIEGASSALVENGERMASADRHALALSVLARTQEMSARVSKLLQMTRLDSGAVALETDWVSMAETAGSALRTLEPTLRAHRLVVQIPNDLPLLRADAALIAQCLENLLENAARHTPRGTVVRVSARVIGQDVVTSVEDYGGNTPADLERIFDKFVQGREGSEGIGLGLAICRAIVKLHGGRIWAEARDGGGTAFRFALPAATMPALPEEPVTT